jgi:hypothetical protein
VTVLLTPMKMPETITAGISTAWSVVQIEITRIVTAKAARLAYIVVAMPNRAWLQPGEWAPLEASWLHLGGLASAARYI